MTKIMVDHLGRGAFVYIRQSTADQLLHNLESRRRQYGLADRARQLGWTTVEVIDDDLGRSGILAGRAAASIGRASSGCWQRSAKAALVPYSRSKRRDWLVTAATGTR
jgi:hypothetical protein